MKTKALRLLPLMLLLGLGQVMARPVDLQTAREVGARFMNANTRTPLRGAEDLQLVTTYSITRGDAAFYVFNTPNGFVIVAADDCATPILGYSDEGRPFDPDNVPIQLQGYLKGFVEQIQYGIENHVQDETATRQWELVRSIGRLNNNRDGEVVEPLVTALWDQGCYYNAMCPEDPDGYCGGHVPTGCVATAMGMIMHYWGYPTHGKGSHNYTPDGYSTQTANYGETIYDWDNMPDLLDENSTQIQIDAVSTLLWHCGVSVDMNYHSNSSGAYDEWVPDAFLWYFNYAEGIERKEKNSNPTWIIDIKNNLRAGIPVYYSGVDDNGYGGHAFVCDGFDSNDYLHFNWGWSGSSNGYYAVDALNVYGYHFNYDNYAILNLEPGCDYDTTYYVTLVSNNQQMGNVYGEGFFNCSELCSIVALPNEGYQFDYWVEDGEVISTDSSYTFTITTNHLLEAHFSIKAFAIVATTNPTSGGDIIGNTNTSILYYDDGIYFCDYGEGQNSTIYWGNMFPASDLVNYSGMFLDIVSVYINIGFSGKIMVYQGGDNAPDMLVYQQQFRCDRSHIYCDIPLLSPVEIDINKNLWIIICYSGGRLRNVASWSHNNDNPNGRWFSVADGTWWFTLGDNDHLGWMIRGHLASTNHDHNDASDLWVGSFEDGQTCTLIAVPSDGCIFENWSEDSVIVSTNDVYSFQVSNNRDLTANFACNVVVSADPTEGGIVSGGGIYHSGDICTVSAFANVNAGYQFYCWTENGETVSMTSEYSFTVSSARTIVAHFGPPLNIIASPNTSIGGVVSGHGTYNYGDNCIMSAIANEGFSFVKWTENGQTVSRQENYSFNVTSDRNLVAHFANADSTCIIVFEPLWGPEWTDAALVATYEDGFSESFEVFQGIPAEYLRVIYQGEHITLSLSTGNWNWNRPSLPAKVSYENNVPIFEGVFPEEESIYEFEGNCIEAFASHTIIANPNITEGGFVTGGGIYDGGEICTLIATPNDGYNFLRWIEEGEIISYDSVMTFMVTDDRSIVAEFTDENVCEMIISLEWMFWELFGNYMIIDYGDSTSEQLGGAYEMPDYNNTNWAGYDVYGDWASYSVKVVDGSHISVSGEPGQYTIKYSSGCSIYEGSSPTDFIINCSAGYETFNITTTINLESAGLITGSGTYTVGHICTVTATENEGYSFLYWTIDGECVSRNSSYSFIVTGDRVLEANFVESEYICPIVINLSWYDWYTNNALIISYDDGFTEQLTVEDYDHSTYYRNILNGSLVSLSWINGTNAQMCSFAVSYVGGELIYYGSNLSAGHIYDFIVNCSNSYISHEIIAMAEPNVGGQITGAGFFNHGNICSLTAVPNEGYTFINWTKEGEEVSNCETFSFNVIESGVYLANFTESSATQTAELFKGWTWWAPTVETNVADIAAALGDKLETIQAKDGTPSGNTVLGQMYRIKTTEDCTLTVSGIRTATSVTVTVAQGYNWFGYTGMQPLAIENLSITPAEGDKVISQDEGFAVYNGSTWEGTLTTLQPGHGYVYVSTANGTKTITFD